MFGLGEVWKYMRSDTIGKVDDTELVLVECNATVSAWAAAASNPKLHTSLAPDTIPAKTIGTIRMIVSRALDLNPVLLAGGASAHTDHT